MNIKELKPKMGNVEITAEVVSIEDARTFNKFGKPGRVANATIKDESGQIKLTLWNEQIDLVNDGDKIKISNGYVSEWQGEMQLSTGRLGTLEVITKSGKPVGKAAPTPKDERGYGDSTDNFEEEEPSDDNDDEYTDEESVEDEK